MIIRYGLCLLAWSLGDLGVISMSSLKPIEQFHKDALIALNTYRAQFEAYPDGSGMHPLCMSRKLNRSAQMTAEWEAEFDIQRHGLLIDPGSTIKFNEFDTQFSAENLAANYYGVPLPNVIRATERLKESTEGHNEIMLSPFYTHFGVGEAKNTQTGKVYTVQHFGLSNTEPCDYTYTPSRPSQMRSFTPTQLAGYNKSFEVFDSFGRLKIRKPYDIIENPPPSAETLPDNMVRIWKPTPLETYLRKYWDHIDRLPPETAAYKKWLELGGKPVNRPPPPVVNYWTQNRQQPSISSAQPSNHNASSPPPSSPRAAGRAAEMIRQEGAGQIGSPASPKDLNQAIIEHDQNKAMDVPHSTEALKERLLDPKMVLLISGVIMGLGLLWYFHGHIYTFFKATYERTVDWIYGTRKNQRIGADKLSTEAKEMAKWVAKKDNKSPPLFQRDNSHQILEMREKKITFEKFENLLSNGLVQLNFPYLETLLSHMKQIIERTNPSQGSKIPLDEAAKILGYVTKNHVPINLLETFIRRSGWLTNSRHLDQKMMDAIVRKVTQSHPTYQISAFFILEKYGFPVDRMEIKIPLQYAQSVTYEMADLISKLIQSYFKVSKTAIETNIFDLRNGDILMLEKLLRSTSCQSAKKSNKPACEKIIQVVKSFSDQIKKRLNNSDVPYLAFALKVQDEEAYDSDLGMFMLAKMTWKLPNSKRTIKPEAELLRNLALEQRPKYSPCHPQDSKFAQTNSLILPLILKAEFNKYSVEIRRGFARGIMVWGLGISPYDLPNIRFTHGNVQEVFRDYLKAYCGSLGEVPAAQIIFLDKASGLHNPINQRKAPLKNRYPNKK